MDDAVDAAGGAEAGALPNLVVIGAMKSGTSALHEYLKCHPDIAMSQPKELNFFFGPADYSAVGNAVTCGPVRNHLPAKWAVGNWHRGAGWYAAHFDPHSPVRGESSPGYTSPSFPHVAPRMAGLIPAARLVYLVRDPIERAVSQYRHHCREGTETRTLEEALLDPNSHYVERGRYYERLTPFLAHFRRCDIAVITQEELLVNRRRTLSAVFAFVGVDESYWSSSLLRRWNQSEGTPPSTERRLRDRLTEVLRDDADRLREFAGRVFPGWSV